MLQVKEWKNGQRNNVTTWKKGAVSANVLDTILFACYTLAVQYVIAKSTRQLLKVEQQLSTAINKTIFLLSQKQQQQRQGDDDNDNTAAATASVVEKIMVGCTKAEHVLEDLEIVNNNTKFIVVTVS